jgi:nickel/cobalt exporter
LKSILPGLLGASLLISFFHAAIPSHWLPFVLVGRGGRWSRAKTLLITLIAGGGHVLTTAILGALIAITGMNLFERFGNATQVLAGTILVLFGTVYIVTSRIRHGKSHGHGHAIPDHASVLSLLLILSFSPCEGMLPIYLVVSKYGWPAFFLASSVLALGALFGMFVFVNAAMSGMERLKLAFLEEHEGALIGGMMIGLGILVLVFE